MLQKHHEVLQEVKGQVILIPLLISLHRLPLTAVLELGLMVSLTVYSVVIFSHKYLGSVLINVNTYVLTMMRTLFIDPSERHNTTQTSK